MVLAIVLTIALVVGFSGFAMRFRIREYLDGKRRRSTGDQAWYEVVQESGRKGGPYQASAFEGVRILAHFLNSFTLSTHRSRPRVTFVWLKSADDPDRLMRLYVGVNANAGEAGQNAIRSYAKSIGARLEAAPGIEAHFPYEAIVQARRDEAVPGQVRDVVDEIGVAANAVATVADGAGNASTCAVFLTLDGMGRYEQGMLGSAIMTNAVKSAGHSALFAANLAPSVRSMSENSVRAGLMAASSDTDTYTSQALVTAAAMSASTLGYSVTTRPPREFHIRETAVVGVGALATLLVMGLFGQWVPSIAGIVLVLGAAAAMMFTDSIDGPIARAAQRGEVLMPEFLPKPLSLRRGVVRLFLKARAARNRGEDDGRGKVDVPPTPFPSPSEVLTVHASSMFELLTFPSGGDASLMAGDRLQSRGLPPNMVDVDEGIFVGMSGTGQPVFLDLEDMHYSLYTAGAPNSGKSNLLLVIFAGIVKASARQTSGLSISPIWGETKGEGAYDAWRVARVHPRAVFVDVHNPNGNARLALEGRRLSEGENVPTVLANCTRVVSSLQAAYGDGIKSQAREIFDGVLRCAMLMTAEEIRFAGLGDVVNADKPNIMELSFYLLLGDSRLDPSAKMLVLGGTLSKSDGLREQELSRAIGTMSRFWEPSQRRNYVDRTSTVLNKLNDMRNAPMLWTPDPRRQDVYVGQLVQSFAPSVVNMGSFYDAATRQFSQTVDRSISQRLIRSFNYLLWDYIKGRCNGWQVERKRVPMFFDEVADVAANAEGDDVPNTLEEGTKEGRSRGAAYFLGSQYPSQMPDMVRHQVLASRGKFWFGMQNSSDLQLAVSDLMVDAAEAEGAITPSSVKSLDNGVCFATIPRHNSVSPPFLLRVPKYSDWARMLFAPENADTHDAVADWAQHIDVAGAAR